jgi:hypothetical protein
MKTRHTLIIAGAAVASAGALFALSQRSAAPAEAPDGAERAPDGFVAGALPEHTCGLEPGAVASYTWRATDDARVDSAALGLTPAGTAPTRNLVETSFTLTTRVLESRDGAAVVLARMTDVSSGAVAQPRELEQPFLLEVATDCQLTGFAYLDTTHRGHARRQQSLMFDASWRAGAEAMTGAGEMGEFEADLALEVSADALTTTRTARSYDLWAHQRATPIALEASALTVTHSTRGLFERAALVESFTGEHVTLRRTMHAERVEATPEVLTGAPTAPSAYVWEDLLPHDLSAPAPDPLVAARARNVEAMRGVPFEVALEDHVARNAEVAPIQRAWPPLRDWLEANPGQTSELIARIKAGEMEDRAQMTAYMALGEAHTPEARRALTSIMDDPSAPVIQRSRAVLALINRPDTGVELAESLSGHSIPIASGAHEAERAFARQSILALGAMSGARANDRDVREVAERTVRSALGSLTEPIHRRPAYGALANIGDPRDLELVADIPGHPDRDMRKAAARVFRRMNPRDSDAFVESWLRQETSMQVKRELYDTLDKQTYDTKVSPGDGILGLAARELDARPGLAMRRSLIHLLSRELERRPHDPLGVRPVMEAAAAYELETNSGLYRRAASQLHYDRLAEITREATSRADQGGGSGAVTPTTSPGTRSTP